MTMEERHQLLSMMLDAVYVDMTQGLVLGLKPKPEFLPLFNLGEPVTTGDSELVTGGMEQSPTTQQLNSPLSPRITPVHPTYLHPL